ncbi:acyl-CoA dehydrogenase [Rhodobacterales bacterium 52_120_T64]|nr:acyl-CoA dehydrogenase [Rhodobacterales bacterium 52_120_T64]
MSTEHEEDLRLLRDSVSTLLDRAGGVARARRVRDEGKGRDNDVWRELAEAGVLGVATPENAGGLGMGLSAAGVIAEEVGRVIAPEPVVPTLAMAIGLLHRTCPDVPVLAALIAGETTLAVAWQERDLRGVSETIDCRFVGGKLTGSKDWIMGHADGAPLLVIAKMDDGLALVQVAGDAKGVTAKSARQSDGSAQYSISFAATPASVLAEGPLVAAALSEAVADATALTAAELLGLSGAALELTLEYIKTREQFDKPIGSFQVIQHRAVDMKIMQEIAEAAVREALTVMDNAATPLVRLRQASRAKARACTAAQQITRESIQLHGAVGYTDEFDVGLLLNRALVLSAWLGDAAYHRRRWLEIRDTEEAAQ